MVGNGAVQPGRDRDLSGQWRTEGIERPPGRRVLMPSLGAAHLLVGIVIVGLTLDSRRFRALARLTGRNRSDHRAPALPDGNLDRVGLPLRLVQMRINVDWQDGAAGWTGPEVLPDEDVADEPAADWGVSLFRGDESWSG